MKYKVIFSNTIFCLLVLSGCMPSYQNNKILSNESIKATIINKITVPSKDDVIKQINLGIMIIEESIENYTKKNPDKKPEDKLSRSGEPSLKQVQMLKRIKSDLENNKISPEDAWEKVIDIRDGKRPNN